METHPIASELLDVLFEDDHVLAVNKPSGLLIHRGLAADRDTLVRRVREYLGAEKAHPVQRLDRATSGVVLLAKSPEMARILGAQLAEGRISKIYRVLVRGYAPEQMRIDHPVAPDPGSKERVDAVTEIRRLATAATEPRETSWMEARPLTGRYHQIRRHFRHISHHVIGDTKHGRGPLNRAFRARYGLERLALHALRIELAHPVSGADLCLEAPLPDDLRAPLEQMGYCP